MIRIKLIKKLIYTPHRMPGYHNRLNPKSPSIAEKSALALPAPGLGRPRPKPLSFLSTPNEVSFVENPPPPRPAPRPKPPYGEKEKKTSIAINENIDYNIK